MTHSAPPAHPLLGHLPALQRDPLAFLTECARGYGSVVPLRLPFLHAFLLRDPADIERVLVTDHREFVKPIWLRTAAVRRLLGDGLVTSDGERWRGQRKVCQPAFLPNALPGYGATMARLAERALAEWSPGDIRDIGRDMANLTLAIVGETLLGVDIARQAPEIGAAMDTIMACFAEDRSLFGLMPLPPTRREAEAVRRLDRLVDDAIARRSAPSTTAAQCPAHSETLLSLLGEPKSPGGRRALREQVKTFLAAGYESSALTLTWAFALLADHPEADSRMAAELAEILGHRTPTPDDLPRLSYTQAVIKETLRLYPPLWMTGRKAARACEIGGVRIPAGALILTSQWAVQRLPHYFPEPDRFRPERWLSTETADLPRYAYFPFGGGPRVCIGQGFATMETVLLLGSVARRFRCERVDEAEVRAWATMTLRPEGRVRMRVVERES